MKHHESKTYKTISLNDALGQVTCGSRLCHEAFKRRCYGEYGVGNHLG